MLHDDLMRAQGSLHLSLHTCKHRRSRASEMDLHVMERTKVRSISLARDLLCLHVRALLASVSCLQCTLRWLSRACSTLFVNFLRSRSTVAGVVEALVGLGEEDEDLTLACKAKQICELFVRRCHSLLEWSSCELSAFLKFVQCILV